MILEGGSALKCPPEQNVIRMPPHVRRESGICFGSYEKEQYFVLLQGGIMDRSALCNTFDVIITAKVTERITKKMPQFWKVVDSCTCDCSYDEVRTSIRM